MSGGDAHAERAEALAVGPVADGANAAKTPRVIHTSEALGFLMRVALPTWAQGLLLRRPWVTALAERWQFDRRAILYLQKLRRKYGNGPLLLRIGKRVHLILLAATDVARVLEGEASAFTPATDEKRAALLNFEPHGSLITRAPGERALRRHFSEEILEQTRPVHSCAARFAAVVGGEAAQLLDELRTGTDLTWRKFSAAWFRSVRAIVLGTHAREDDRLTQELAKLRANANWVFTPLRRRMRAKYYDRLRGYLDNAESGSLAEMIAKKSRRSGLHPEDQVTQWLFAFDGGAMTAFRALALLAADPDNARGADPDLAAWSVGAFDMPYLRAAFAETVRLWPTTPALLRQSTETTVWGGATLSEGTSVVMYVPFFHRDDERMPEADRFLPERWLGKDPGAALPFVPFSAGPTACPGRQLVALLGSFWLAGLMNGGRFEPSRKIGPETALPATLDHASIRLRVTTGQVTPRI